MSPARRLAVFALSLAALAGCAEAFVRAHEAAFAAATNRALAKSAILDGHGPVDVLFFGTSRMQDGVAPRLFSEELKRLGEGDVPAFNLAFTSSSLQSLEALAVRYRDRPGLRLAIVELSVPQLENGPPAWEAPSVPPGVEGELTSFVHRHARLVADRAALVSDNLVRLPSLLWFASALDGSETRVADQLLAFLGRREAAPAPFEEKAWEPVRYGGVPSPQPSPLSGEREPPSDGRESRDPSEGMEPRDPSEGRESRDPSEGREPQDPLPQRGRGQGEGAPDAALVDRLVRLAHAFGAARVVFVVPPYTRRFDDPQERSPRFKRLFAAVARASGSPVWDFTELTLPDRDFRGLSHLNHAGRALFSTVLAREVARAHLLSPPVVAR